MAVAKLQIQEFGLFITLSGKSSPNIIQDLHLCDMITKLKKTTVRDSSIQVFFSSDVSYLQCDGLILTSQC